MPEEIGRSGTQKRVHTAEAQSEAGLCFHWPGACEGSATKMLTIIEAKKHKAYIKSHSRKLRRLLQAEQLRAWMLHKIKASFTEVHQDCLAQPTVHVLPASACSRAVTRISNCHTLRCSRYHTANVLVLNSVVSMSLHHWMRKPTGVTTPAGDASPTSECQ